MVYDANRHKSGCIDSITAGSYVIFDDKRWRVARTTSEYVEVYRLHETAQILLRDDVTPVNGGDN